MRTVGKKWYKELTSTKAPDKLYLSIALWGKTGAGKTHFMGTAPNLFVLAAEPGTLTLVGKDVTVFPLSKEMPIFETVKFIIRSARDKEVLADEDGNVLIDWTKIETFGIDSASKLNELIIEEVKRQTGHPQLQQPDWGIVRSRMQEIVTEIIDLPMHKISTSGEAVREDKEDEDSMEVTVNMQGGYRNQYFHEFDFVLYLEERTRGKNRSYITHTSKYRGRVAKTRVTLPSEIENCNFQTLEEAVAKKLKEKA